MSLIDSENDSLELTRKHLTESVRFPLAAVLFLWIVYIFQELDGFDPGLYGIMSRRLWGIRGIVTGPLVHGSWGHLISNTVPLFVLAFLTFYFYRKIAAQAFWLIYFLTGIAVWLFARPVSHIGASGVVYGLVEHAVSHTGSAGDALVQRDVHGCITGSGGGIVGEPPAWKPCRHFCGVSVQVGAGG